VLVAVLVASILLGICVTICVAVMSFKGRSERLMVINEDARGILRAIERDLNGLYVSSDSLEDYYEVEPGDPGCGNKLTVRAATENAGKLDYCMVSYYVRRQVASDPASGVLYRELSGGQPPDGDWLPPGDNHWAMAQGVLSIEFSPDESDVVTDGGKLPPEITVRVLFHDSGGLLSRDGQHLPRLFSIKVVPGSEER
jgi:hypothetical protein